MVNTTVKAKLDGIIYVEDFIKNYMNDEYVKGYFAKVPPTKRQLKKLDNETQKAKFQLENILSRFKQEMSLSLEIEQLGNGRFHVNILDKNGNKATSYSSLNQKSIWTILDKLDLILSFNAESSFYKRQEQEQEYNFEEQEQARQEELNRKDFNDYSEFNSENPYYRQEEQEQNYICDECKEPLEKTELNFNLRKYEGLMDLFGITCSNCSALAESGGLMYKDFESQENPFNDSLDTLNTKKEQA